MNMYEEFHRSKVEYINIDEYVAIVEAYILHRTGKRVKIVFDNAMMFRRHFKMLVEAHDKALDYYKNTK